MEQTQKEKVVEQEQPNQIVCENCGNKDHRQEAKFCKICGKKLKKANDLDRN